MNSIVERLREYQKSWADSIKRMDCGEFGDNGIMSQIRAEQHATWKEAADEIERLTKALHGKAEALMTQTNEIERLRSLLQNGSPVVEGTIQHMAMEIAALKKELAALRQRIADAKVVQKSKRQLLSRVEELSLIVKEDLLK